MKVVSLHADFGAEIRDISLLDVASREDAYLAVRAAFEEHSVLVWREQTITDEIQATFSRAFGPLELTKVGSLGEGTFYARVTNIGPDGTPVPPTHRQALVGRANALWHTDSSFKKIPALASVLSARTITRSGGETEFVSTRAAWSRLSASEKSALQDATVEHSYTYSRRHIDSQLVGPDELKALPPVRWRMSWLNPVNGRRSMYLASHAGAIEGMDEHEATRLLEDLIVRATQPQFVYRHVWRPGDVVMWDNRATMHRGRPSGAGEARALVRTTISAGDADGLAQLRPATAAFA
jgi:alpha-ketoglutarate-dependent 2,4-dichlorophenoxyacetate dioxygenase